MESCEGDLDEREEFYFGNETSSGEEDPDEQVVPLNELVQVNLNRPWLISKEFGRV